MLRLAFLNTFGAKEQHLHLLQRKHINCNGCKALCVTIIDVDRSVNLV